jgi:hypothetical protein
MKKQIILSVLFSSVAQTEKPAVAPTKQQPATEMQKAKEDKATGLENAEARTAGKPANEVVKANMEKKQQPKQKKGTTGTTKGDSSRRDAAQKELRSLESNKKKAKLPKSEAPSKGSRKGTATEGTLKGSSSPAQPASGSDKDVQQADERKQKG